MTAQKKRYDDFYSKFIKLRWFFRFDVRYRCKRIHEVFNKLNIKTDQVKVLDFGCATGDMLKTFPANCHITGADVSASAIDYLSNNPNSNHLQKRILKL